ncbi:hypothetical protein MKX03_035880 [Papaver bracteatum]|nr:hypothetical protein MKX03_035880 [Papaver bracteatum]
MGRVEMEAAVRRSVALILMKHNGYVGGREKLIEARTSYPGLEYVNELIKLCDIVCAAGFQGSEVDWCSILQIDRTADESEIELKYTELMGTLEPIKNKFVEIQSALGLVEKAYSAFKDRDKRPEADLRGDVSLSPAKPVDVATSETMDINGGATSQVSSGTKRNASEGSDEICNSGEQPLKRVRSLGGDDFEVIAETQSLDKLIGKGCSQEASLGTSQIKTTLNEVEGSLGRSPRSPMNLNTEAISQISSGTKRNVSEGSDESNLICNSGEQPLKRVRSLGGDASLIPCGFVKPLDGAHSETVNVNGEATLQNSCGTTRIVGEDSDKSSLICNSGEQPLERVRSSGGEDCELLDETESLDKLIGKGCSQGTGSDTAEINSRLNDVLNPDPLSVPEAGDGVVDTVAAEFSNGAWIKLQNSRSPPITPVLNPEIRRQCAGDVAPGGQNVKQPDTTSRPLTCEEKESQAGGTSKDENTSSSNNLETDGASRENVGNLTAKDGEEKVAEEIDFESDGVSLGGVMVNVSECGNSASHSDDAVNKLVDKEKVAEEIDTESDCVRLGGDDGELIAETQSLNKLPGKVCGQQVRLDTAKRSTGSSEVEGSLGRVSGSIVKTVVHKAGTFAVGQFLAFYDQEKMPRLYAQINQIESCYSEETKSTENTLYIRWLRPAPINSDEKKWHEVGLPVSCGFFKLDSDEIDQGNLVVGNHPVISHVVTSFQEHRYSDELVELYPREGEVWALYKEWNPFDWCLDPETRKGCKFHLVEVLNDYSTENGVTVACLVKVAGHETIFQRSGLPFQIAARYLFGFSHNIPVKSTGDMRGLFSGIDLDPLSIPENVFVDTVAADVNIDSSIKHPNSRPAPITSMPDPKICAVNQCAGGSSRENVGSQTATNVAEEIDFDGFSFGGYMVNVSEFGTSSGDSDEAVKVAEQSDGVSKFMVNESECGNSSSDSDNAVNELDDEEEMADAIDSENDGVSLGGFMESECENSSSDSDDTVNKLDIGQVIEIIKRNRNKESEWQTEDDMLSSLEEDPDLCMKAVCALHRQQLTKGKSVKSSLHNRNRRFSVFSKFVALRGSEMAEFLTDNNPKGDLKKSAKELEAFIPEGLEDCKALARFYSNELFIIYQNHEDPFFGPFLLIG